MLNNEAVQNTLYDDCKHRIFLADGAALKQVANRKEAEGGVKCLTQ